MLQQNSSGSRSRLALGAEQRARKCRRAQHPAPRLCAARLWQQPKCPKQQHPGRLLLCEASLPHLPAGRQAYRTCSIPSNMRRTGRRPIQHPPKAASPHSQRPSSNDSCGQHPPQQKQVKPPVCGSIHFRPPSSSSFSTHPARSTRLHTASSNRCRKLVKGACSRGHRRRPTVRSPAQGRRPARSCRPGQAPPWLPSSPLGGPAVQASPFNRPRGCCSHLTRRCQSVRYASMRGWAQCKDLHGWLGCPGRLAATLRAQPCCVCPCIISPGLILHGIPAAG